MWTCTYSSVCLKNILPPQHLEWWLHFVKAAIALCSNVRTHRLCNDAHQEAIQFCRQFKELYGKSECVPNMHYMCHLHECLQDYGSAAGIWLFPFECMNGILGETHTNRRDIPQLMKHFLAKKETAKPINRQPDDLKEAFVFTNK